MSEHENGAVPLEMHPCCLDLRHKMMHCDERQATPGLVDSSSPTRVYYCRCTQDDHGPDGSVVHPDACDSGRPCFKEAPGLFARARPAAGDAHEA